MPDGARHVVWDRDQPAPAELTDGTYDAVVDVARHPSRVRSAVAAVPDAHWVFVSTISVYADNSVPGGSPGVTPELEPITEDVDLRENMEAYGPMKVACEQAVLAGAASAMVVRPGLIIGPGDPSGRFTYWPLRLRDAGDGGEVLAPGTPDDTVQVVDVRDLASWIVDSAEAGRTGTVDGIGPVQRFADLLDDVAKGVGSEPSYTWVDQDFLQSRESSPGPARSRCPCGCRDPSTTGCWHTTRTCHVRRGCTRARCPSPPATPWLGPTRRRTPCRPGSAATGSASSWRSGARSEPGGQPVSTLASWSAALSAPPRRTGR